MAIVMKYPGPFDNQLAVRCGSRLIPMDRAHVVIRLPGVQVIPERCHECSRVRRGKWCVGGRSEWVSKGNDAVHADIQA